MKLHQLLLEDVTLPRVGHLDDLIDPRTNKYYTGEVNVNGNVWLTNTELTELPPVKFGTIGDSFYCYSNKIISLEGIHKYIKKMGGGFDISNNPIKTGGIGLLLIEGIRFIRSELRAFHIIDSYLGQGKKGLLLCQEELIEAGLEEYAKL